MLCNTRERRANAGNKMASLLENEDADDFYQSAYGGFADEADDPEYSEEDEFETDTDSDSDISGDENDEPVSDQEEEETTKRKHKVVTKAYKEPTANKIKKEPKKHAPKTTTSTPIATTIGMLRISESFSAENCVKAVETKLQEFGIITEKHIVVCVTDGASTMVKFGKIMSCEYHLCYAHAIHLAVCDVLYNKQIDLVENTVEVENKSHEEDNGESDELVENLNKALDLEFESRVGTDALFHVTYAEKNTITNVNETIKKIKNVVKLFRKSPIKNDILQKYVKEEFGCEKMVCLDTKTRWNSLLPMLERFLEIKSAISKALIDIKEEQMMVNVEFETDYNCKRLKARLMQYLNFGRKYEAAAITGDILQLPGKNCLVRQAQMIWTRLFCEEEESISNSSH
ncbi:BED-type domain-containing protein [Trichonephila clavipes]|nr:BED-type domain-containing protein [Trichonephila clavipes]